MRPGRLQGKVVTAVTISLVTFNTYKVKKEGKQVCSTEVQ